MTAWLKRLSTRAKVLLGFGTIIGLAILLGAIFGNEGPALFVSASSLGPALICLDATIVVVGPKEKKRTIAAAEFSSVNTSFWSCHDELITNGSRAKAMAPQNAQRTRPPRNTPIGLLP